VEAKAGARMPFGKRRAARRGRLEDRGLCGDGLYVSSLTMMSASARAPVGAGSIKHPAAGHGGGREAGQGPHRKAIAWPPANPGWATKPRASPRLCERHCPAPMDHRGGPPPLGELEVRESTLAHRGERDATSLPVPPKRRSKPRQALPQRVAYGSRARVLTRCPDQAAQAGGNPGLAHLCNRTRLEGSGACGEQSWRDFCTGGLLICGFRLG
jgi:hypothetical protein